MSAALNGWPPAAAILGADGAEVPEAAAGVVDRVGVQHLDPVAAVRQPNAVALPRHGRQVRDADELACPVARAAHECEHVRHRVVRLEPLEAVAREVDLPERRLVAVDRVQVAHEVAHARVIGVLEQRPRQLALVGPLPRRRELAAHEEELACLDAPT